VIYTKKSTNIKNSTKTIIRDTIHTLLHGNLNLLIAQSALILIFTMTFTPILTFAVKSIQKLANVSYFTPNNLLRVIMNPPSLLIILLLLAITSVFMLIELYFLSAYFKLKGWQTSQKNPPLKMVISVVANKMIRTPVIAHIRSIATVWVTIINANIPAILFFTYENRFLNYLAAEVSNVAIWSIIIAVILISTTIFFFKKPRQTQQEYSGTGAHESALKTTLKTHIIWLALQSVAFAIVYAVSIGIALLTVIRITERQIAVATFIRLVDRLDHYFVLILFIMGTICHSALFSRLDDLRLSNTSHHHPDTFHYHGKLLHKARYRNVLVISIIAILAMNLFFFYDIVKNGSILDAISIGDIQITAHRGFSAHYPENTMPSVSRAIEEKSDYVEIDVRMTKDGELVLLHDASLKRTTGLNRYIWEMTYEEIEALDAGMWRREFLEIVPIPKLRDVFELAKGQVYLNIDLKYTGYQDDVVPRLVSLIHEYDMVWQCIVTSTHLDDLAEIKAIDPDIQTGYITYQISDRVLESDFVDAFSMKSTLVSKNVVESIHRSGKKIHVWTVNTRSEIERMSRLGVDNIITDNPVFAREVLYAAGGDRLLLTLLKVVFE
jgi:glycerophosphoryl diester phosphodiesterase